MMKLIFKLHSLFMTGHYPKQSSFMNKTSLTINTAINIIPQIPTMGLCKLYGFTTPHRWQLFESVASNVYGVYIAYTVRCCAVTSHVAFSLGN